MIKLTRGKGVWIWGVVAVLLVVIAFFSTQAFSASISVTAQPLQNAGNGDLTYSSDWERGGNSWGVCQRDAKRNRGPWCQGRQAYYQ